MKDVHPPQLYQLLRYAQDLEEKVMLKRLSVGIAGSLLLYALAAIWFMIVTRDLVGPDGIAYIRIAGYYLDGNLNLAASPHWGPLLSWLIMPLLAAGIDGVLAAKIVSFLAGGLVLIGVHRLSKMAGLNGPFRACLGIAAPMLVSRWLASCSVMSASK